MTTSDGVLERAGRFFFRFRDALFPTVVVLMLVLTRPRLAGGSDRTDLWLDAAGVLVALAGQVLRIAVVGYAYIIRGGKNKQVYAESLVTRGFFATSRNPLYVGNLLVFFGLFLIWNNVWVYIVGVPFFLFAYRAIVAAEERFLREKFGSEYDAYAARVNRWWPDFRKLRGGALDGFEFNWRRVVLKEYGSTAYWVAAALVLMILDTPDGLRADGLYAGRATVLVALIALTAVFWAYARWLKKSKRLRE